MHKLKQKRGKKSVTHHFHHITETDGSKKPVYLGTNPKKAKEKLTKLQVERIRSNNRLIQKMEDVQVKLDRLGHHNRPFDDIVSDIEKRYSRQKHSEALLDQAIAPAFPWHKYTLIFTVSFVAFFLISYSILSGPVITGSAVQKLTSVTKNEIVSVGSAILAAIILLFGFLLHYSEYGRKKKEN